MLIKRQLMPVINLLPLNQKSLSSVNSLIEDDNALLMSNVQYLEENVILFKSCYNYKGLSIFTTVKTYFAKNNILLNNIVGYSTKRVIPFIGRYYDSIAYLKVNVTKIFYIPCISCEIQMQHIVGKYLSANFFSHLIK